MGSLEREEQRAKRRAAILRRLGLLRKLRWRLPSLPECPRCESVAGAVVYNTGDSWTWGWECHYCGPDDFNWDDGGPGVGPAIAWPFVVNWANGKDWERAGFELV